MSEDIVSVVEYVKHELVSQRIAPKFQNNPFGENSRDADYKYEIY